MEAKALWIDLTHGLLARVAVLQQYAYACPFAGVLVCLSSPWVTHFCRLFMKRPLSLGLRAATTCDVIKLRFVRVAESISFSCHAMSCHFISTYK